MARLFISLFLLAFLLSGCIDAGPAPPTGTTPSTDNYVENGGGLQPPAACFPGTTAPCLTLEIADTPEKQQTGLMYRDALEPNTGMLFPFDQPRQPTFWMKNVRFPIDILWLDLDGTVVDVSASIPPCTADPCPLYSPSSPVWFALETEAGFAQTRGLEKGASVEIYAPR